MKALERRLEAMEAALQVSRYKTHSREELARLFAVLERYASQAPRHPAGTSIMELIAHGQYEEALAAEARLGRGEEARLNILNLIVTWEAHKQGTTVDELLERELAARGA